MAKVCDAQGCYYPVFGTDKYTKKRYCRNHQYLRTDTKKSVRNNNLAQRNEKLERNKFDFDPFQYGFSSERDLFEYLWSIKPHRSEISGRKLDKITLWFSMFAHVLEKKNYPLFRYNPENIVIVHPLEHVLIDQGSSDARKKYTKDFPEADFSIFFRKKEELFREYPKIRSYG